MKTLLYLLCILMLASCAVNEKSCKYKVAQHHKAQKVKEQQARKSKSKPSTVHYARYIRKGVIH